MERAAEPSPHSDAEVSDEPPLFVDLDGTLIAGDSLFESLFAATKSRPLKAFAFPFWLLRGRACLKEELAKLARLDPALLPYRSDVCDFLRAERARGRKIYLATAANERIAQGVATYLGFFDGVLASDRTTNLKGTNKLRAIQALVGARFAVRHCHGVPRGDGAIAGRARTTQRTRHARSRDGHRALDRGCSPHEISRADRRTDAKARRGTALFGVTSSFYLL